mmetsp:Transcript_25821/g.59038  ORF Transcript_25821/g.59038 Transcript_25821/m.59038 type:complete len:506 (+) Transcript_25821:36-1553(+)
MVQNDSLVIEQASVPSHRVEGWVQYYDYFHKLNDDMQRTTDIAAQRRASPSGSGPLLPLPKRDTTCFDQIAAALKEHDKPLVQIVDHSDGSSTLEDGVEPPPGGRKLTNDDLALVRAQLRAAAQATNEQAALQDGAQRQAAAAEFAAAAAHSRRNGRKGASDGRPGADDPESNTCAAAIETLVWFGLALGDKEKEAKKGRAEAEAGLHSSTLLPWGHGFQGEPDDDDYLSENSLATEVMKGVDSLTELGEWDWQQAMREAGIDEEPDELKISSLRPLTPQELSRALLEEGQRLGFERQELSTMDTPTERVVSDGPEEGQLRAMLAQAAKVPALRPMHELARFDSASERSGTSEGTPSEAGEQSCDLGRRAECDDTRSMMSGEGGAVDECDADGVSSGRTTPRLGYASPDAASRCATRRSRREPKPQQPWVSSMEAPLLKWEKEQQAKPNRSKRRSSSLQSDYREEIGFETDSGEELVNQLISPNELLADSVLDLVFGAEPKRQRC